MHTASWAWNGACRCAPISGCMLVDTKPMLRVGAPESGECRRWCLNSLPSLMAFCGCFTNKFVVC